MGCNTSSVPEAVQSPQYFRTNDLAKLDEQEQREQASDELCQQVHGKLMSSRKTTTVSHVLAQ